MSDSDWIAALAILTVFTAAALFAILGPYGLAS